MNLLEACRDPNLFEPWFRDPGSWANWFVFIKALFALPLDPAELEVYRRCTGRTAAPTEPATEAWLICGRRSGKSFILALLAIYAAAFRDYRPYLAPGEVGTVMVLASDKRQARIIMRYIEALLTEVPMLATMVARRRTGDETGIDLRNQVTIEVYAAHLARVRGYTICTALLDELAFWPSDDSANPDREVIEAIRPAMATIPTATLLCASSPYRRAGVLWEARQRHFAKDGPSLIWQAPTRTMNPTIASRLIQEAYQRDPVAAASEFGAEFRSDLEAFVAREAVEAAVAPGVMERPPMPGVRYRAFCDPSGGARDAMTLAVAHAEGEERCVLDCVRERRPPFSPEAVVEEFAGTLRLYGVREVRGDRYAGEWPREAFRRHRIEYKTADRPKSDIYRDLLPLLNSGRADLLDNPRLVAQLVGLERRTSRGGRDSIDHGPQGSDDLANAAAGALLLAQDAQRPRAVCMNFEDFGKKKPRQMEIFVPMAR